MSPFRNCPAGNLWGLAPGILHTRGEGWRGGSETADPGIHTQRVIYKQQRRGGGGARITTAKTAMARGIHLAHHTPMKFLHFVKDRTVIEDGWQGAALFQTDMPLPVPSAHDPFSPRSILPQMLYKGLEITAPLRFE